MNIEYENITNPVRDPYLFIGTLKKGYDEEACLSFKERKAHMDYHETADCVVQMGVLKKLKGTKTGLTKTGTRKGPEQEEAEEDLYLILVNSATLKGANRYVQVRYRFRFQLQLRVTIGGLLLYSGPDLGQVSASV